MKLANLSAVVTGGASGLGLACARQLAVRGVHVVIADRSAEQGAQAVASLQYACLKPSHVLTRHS